MTDQPLVQAASEHTCRHNHAVAERLDFADSAAFTDIQRGFVGTIPDARIEGEKGHVVWDLSSFGFLEQETAPDSVNPSLWRQARLNNSHGLFQVTEGMYQVRGFDIANMTIIEGASGIIIIDPLMLTQTAHAALNLYYQHRGRRDIKAVIYSHSHPDHYGGVEGVITPEMAASGVVQVIAPDGFMEAAIAETILAGVPMRRRAMFQFGPTLERGPCGHVDSGLGKVTGRGTTSLIAPNWIISEATERHRIDAIDIIFQLTPETEAPAEMNFFFPAMGVLNLAENGCHTMHNLCPIRGAKTRDALAWSKYLDAALRAFIDNTEVVIAQHHWPTWGQERVRRFISEQRDMYRYLHDQTLRLMSHGLTPNEIADAVKMPATLEKRWHTRPYYGAIEHNVRSIYTHYMGPYDGNPTNLNPLPPETAGAKTVEYMGGAEAVLERARADYEQGNYRWVVQVLQHVVFADPDNQAARRLAADAMEQLGYQSESATWRNAYLLGSKELRFGAPKPGRHGVGMISPKVVAMMPMPMIFDFIAMRVNAQKAEGLQLKLDWLMIDEDSCYQLTLSNSALNHCAGSHGSSAQAVIRLDRNKLAAVISTGTQFLEALEEGVIPTQGDVKAVAQLFATLDQFQPMFNIVEP